MATRRNCKALYLSEDEEKKIRKDFIRKTEKPKILIVTEKLLTGFDAPILYCMYLDKPMRDHVLLQAIARVNRPYEDDEGQVKPYGFVLDFVGIFEKLEKALAFDSDVVASVIQNIDVLKQLFATMMQGAGSRIFAIRQGMGRQGQRAGHRALRGEGAAGRLLQVLPPATEPLRSDFPGRFLASRSWMTTWRSPNSTR